MEHINNFTNHFLGEMCKVVKMPGQDFSQELKCDILKKDQLSSWMEVLVVTHAVPYSLSVRSTACGAAKRGNN